jgi:hypothetical protein
MPGTVQPPWCQHQQRSSWGRATWQQEGMGGVAEKGGGVAQAEQRFEGIVFVPLSVRKRCASTRGLPTQSMRDCT